MRPLIIASLIWRPPDERDSFFALRHCIRWGLGLAHLYLYRRSEIRVHERHSEEDENALITMAAHGRRVAATRFFAVPGEQISFFRLWVDGFHRPRNRYFWF